MNSLFNPDNPFMRFLVRVGELVILNFLFLLCCIPVVTAGAAAAALQKSVQTILYDEDEPVTRVYFRAFRGNFKQATLCWLVLLFILCAMGANAFLLNTLFSGNMVKLLGAVLAAITAAVLAVAGVLFPLMVRYENRLLDHVKNAMILALIKLPRAAAMTAMNLFPVIVAWFSFEVLHATFVFWLFIGFAFSSYMNAYLMKKPFQEIEANQVGLLN